MAISQVDLVGNARPVVTPQATAMMAQSVRDGTISILDVMDRVDERTRKKQELELITAKQGIAEAQDPQLIQAARAQKLAAGAQAQNVIATAPLAQKAKDLELKAAIYDAMAKPGGFDLMQTALSKAGFPVSIDLSQGLTDANRAEIVKRFSALDAYTKEKTQAEDRVTNTKSRFEDTFETTSAGTTKKTFQRLFHNEQEVTGDQLKAWTQKNEAIKSTPFSSWYSLRSGQASTPTQPAPAVSQPAAPIVQPATSPPGSEAAAAAAYQTVQAVNPASDATRAQLFNAATAAQAVQPTVAAVPTQSIVQPAPAVGQIAGQTMVTGFTPAPPAKIPEILRPTEGQQRALLAVPRFQEANAALQDLQNRNYDPTSWKSWVDSYLPQVAKSGDRKEFETAMSVWSQGLLRLESGAAITPKEQIWYERAFFPAVNDPPNVVQQKDALRKSVEAMVAELGSAGPIGEELKLRAQGVFQAADTFSRGTTVPATTGSLRLTLPGRGNVEFDPATQRYRPIR